MVIAFPSSIKNISLETSICEYVLILSLFILYNAIRSFEFLSGFEL